MRFPNNLSLNPYGRVPTLEEDGFVLFELTAISQLVMRQRRFAVSSRPREKRRC